MFQSTRAIHCSRCGASTQLPEDLSTPTFACDYCRSELVTADYAGVAAVSADALVDHVERAMADPSSASEAAQRAPRFLGESTAVRASSCVHCGARVDVPMDLTVHVFACRACGRTQSTEAHVSATERLEHDMARQVAGNRALERFFAEGVACTRCGGHVVFPDDGSIQIACPHCRGALVASQWVDASAVARRRLKHAVFDLVDAQKAAQEVRDRQVKRVAIAVASIVLVAIVALQFVAP